jgi:uncharacterized protein (TIGR04255 family)
VPFPNYQRVIYERNPLVEVICQVRFPAILRIDVEPPAAFQDAIRATFPILTESTGLDAPLSIPPEMAQQLPPQLTQQLSALRMAIGSGQKSYTFASEDGDWAIALTRDALSLTTKRYVHWEEFRDRLRPAVDALVAQYQPSHFARVGLRYRDIICRSDLGLDDVPWADLLEPHIAGELSSPAIASDITLAARQLLVSLPDLGGQVLLQHGLSQRDAPQDTCFVIDADFHSTARTEVANVWGLLEGLHGQAGRLFRWCIRDQLHAALDPRPVSD